MFCSTLLPTRSCRFDAKRDAVQERLYHLFEIKGLLSDQGVFQCLTNYIRVMR
jgi:hypothetical protein